MTGSHINLPALDIEHEQNEIDSLIASLQQFQPAAARNRDSNSSGSTSSTAKTAQGKATRGRPPRARDVPSSPVVSASASLCTDSFELIIQCLNKLNSQNQKLINRVTELDSVVQDQNKTIETLQTQVASSVTPNIPPVDASVPTNELFTTVVKRVEKIEENINSHLLLCRGPTVTNKIDNSTTNNVVDLEKIKAEICAEVCGETISKISVSAVGVSIYGKSKKLLKIECANLNVRNHLLEQARRRKPAGIYLVEFLSPEKLKLHQRVNDLKREFPSKVRAVYIRRGDVFCKTEPNGDVIRVSQDEDIDKIRRQFLDQPVIAEEDGTTSAD